MPSSPSRIGQPLSTGAKAGIGVGVAIGVLALSLTAFFLGRSTRRKRHAPLEAGAAGHAADYEYRKPELEGQGLSELGDTGGYEEHVAHELPGGANVSEVEATPVPVPAPAPVPARTSVHEVPERGSREVSSAVEQEEVLISPLDVSGGHTVDQEVLVSPLGVSGGHTYDDPRLVQNPWASDRPL